MHPYIEKIEKTFGKIPNIILALTLLVGILSFVFVFHFSNTSSVSATSKCSIPECNDNQGNKIHILEPFTLSTGFDAGKNIQKICVDSISITKTATEIELEKTRGDLRKKVFEEAIQWIQKVHNFNARGFIQESYGQNIDYEHLKNDLQGQKTPLANALNILKIDEYYNCSTCTYHLEITFFTPNDADNLLPADLRNVIERYIQQAPAYKEFASTDFSLPVQKKVNVMDLLSFLLSNQNFSKDVKNKLDFYKTYMKYMDNETNNFFTETTGGEVRIENFTSGEYELSSVMTLIMRAVLNNFSKQVTDNPLKKWSIETVGYADQSSVKEPIPYDDAGKWSSSGAEISFVANQQKETPIGENILTNLELSYARAYSGLAFLDKNLPSDMVKDIRLHYRGAGIDNSTRDKWQKRRIEIHISNE